MAAAASAQLQHAADMLLDELPKVIDWLNTQSLFEKLSPTHQQKLNQCLDHAQSVLEIAAQTGGAANPSALLAPENAGQLLFFGDLLQTVAACLTLFSKAHDVEGPCAPFMHCFTITTVLCSQFADAALPAASYGIDVGAETSGLDPATTTLGEYVLASLGDHFDYCLREVVFSCGSDDSGTDEMINAKICCRVMWRTLTLCIGGPQKVDGETFLELCGNEVYFPVAFARALIPCEADIAIPLMGLWSAAKNQKAATRVAAQQEGITGVSVLDEEGKRQLPNDESGDLSDIYEYKKQIACAFVDDDIIPELCRALMEAVYQWEQQPEVQEWFVSVLDQTPEVLASQLLPPPPASVLLSPKVQQAGRAVVLLLTCLCRTFSEIANIVTDPHYGAWAVRYANLIGRMKRHLTLHGKGFVTHLVKPHFLPHNSIGMNSDMDMKLRMLVISSGAGGGGAAGAAAVSNDSAANIMDAQVHGTVLRLSNMILDTLLDLKKVNCAQILGSDFLQLVGSSLPYAPPSLSSANDPGVVARIGLLSLDPAAFEPAVDPDGLLAENGTERLTTELLELLAGVAGSRNCADRPQYWRVVMKWFKRLYGGQNVRFAADFWENGVDGSLMNYQENHGGSAAAAGGGDQVSSGNLGFNVASTGGMPEPELEPLLDGDYDNVLSSMEQAGLFFVPQGTIDVSSMFAGTGESPDMSGGNGNGIATTSGGNNGSVALGPKNTGQQAIPEEFRCAIDGRLMQTPVRYVSPVNGNTYVYELSTLQAWAQVQGDVCPVSGETFTPEVPPVVDEELQGRIAAFGFAS